MKYQQTKAFYTFLLVTVSTFVLSGCGASKINVQDLLNEPVQSAGK